MRRGEASVSSSVADRASSGGTARKPDQPVLWESKIYLGEAFFNEIINHPGAPRHEHPQGPQTAPWASISTCGSPTAPSRFAFRYGSPGGSCTVSSERTRPRPATSAPYHAFRRQALRELKKIKLAWPGLNYATAPGVLILHPSTPPSQSLREQISSASPFSQQNPASDGILDGSSKGVPGCR